MAATTNKQDYAIARWALADRGFPREAETPEIVMAVLDAARKLAHRQVGRATTN